MRVVQIDHSGVGRASRSAADVLRADHIVVLPTDTVYGVTADAFSRPATTRVFETRQASPQAPLPVMVPDAGQAEALAGSMPAVGHRLMERFWPGALTLVVCCDRRDWYLGQTDGTVALRMPLEDVVLRTIRLVGPLAMTSACLAGDRAVPRTVEDARQHLGDAVGLYVDGGPRAHTRPSTVVDLTRNEVHVLREGAIPTADVMAVVQGQEPAGRHADTSSDLARVLQEARGVGRVRRDAITEAFGDLDGLRACRDEDLLAIPGVGPSLLAEIRRVSAGS